MGDTPVVPGIYEAAATVVGTTLAAIAAVAKGKCRRAFTPIGGLHHARRFEAAGFCVFNDVGVAIEALRKVHGIQRVLYVDIDAHHGDGVYYHFAEDPNLCIVDFHEDGRYLYPGTGALNETGTGAGAGTKMNIPLLPETGDDFALQLWEKCEGFIRAFKPEFVLLQCGADSLADDPITHLRLTRAFHAHVAGRLAVLADELCEGKMVAMGGGGYDVTNLATAWNDVVEAMIP
jgi:acetoin utilization protein AcuC